jgi:hypothetical protein
MKESRIDFQQKQDTFLSGGGGRMHGIICLPTYSPYAFMTSYFVKAEIILPLASKVPLSISEELHQSSKNKELACDKTLRPHEALHTALIS